MLDTAVVESDYIKTEITPGQILFCDIFLGGGNQITPLGGIDPFGRMTILLRARSLDFDEHDTIIMARDQIDFLVIRLPVALENNISHAN